MQSRSWRKPVPLVAMLMTAISLNLAPPAVYLPEIQAELSIQFHDLFGEKTLQLFLSPKEGKFSGFRALLGQDSVDFETASGKVWIDVLSIDWEHQTVMVKPRLEAG